MAIILSISTKQNSRADIETISQDAARDLCDSLRRHGVQTQNLGFARDLILIRKFIEAAILRKSGFDSPFADYLDEITERITET